jgi:hypothetical protein
VEGDLQGDRVGVVIVDDELLVHTASHEAMAHDRERVFWDAIQRGVREEERRREVIDLFGGQNRRDLAIDLDPVAGEKACVPVEEAVRPHLMDVAAVIGDEEGIALEDFDLTLQIRWILCHIDLPWRSSPI